MTSNQLIVSFNPTVFGVPLETAKAQAEALRGIDPQILAYVSNVGVGKFAAELEALTPPGSRVFAPTVAQTPTTPRPKETKAAVAPTTTPSKTKKVPSNRKLSFEILSNHLGNTERTMLAVKTNLSAKYKVTKSAVEKMIRRYIRLGRILRVVRNGVIWVSMPSAKGIKTVNDPADRKKTYRSEDSSYGAPNSRVFQIEALIKANGGSFPLSDLQKAIPLSTYRLNRILTHAVLNGYLKIEENNGVQTLLRTSNPIPTSYSTEKGKGSQKKSPEAVQPKAAETKPFTGVKFLGADPAYLST